MSLPRVYISRRVPDATLALLQDHCELDIWPEDIAPPRAAFLDALAQADGAMTMLTERVDREALDAAPKLRVISNFAVGYDNIDVPAATARRIPVGNTPGVLTETSADHAFALLLAAARRINEGERYIHAGEWKTWSPLQLLGQEVNGATLGIIGFGRIGQAVARRAQGFRMRILYSGRPKPEAAALEAENVSQDELLARSDFISLHVPLNAQTRHMIGREQFARMKPSAILINTARGPVIDQDALVEALREERIWRAALDVTTPEPLPLDHPLLSLPNCLVVPHLASATRYTRERMGHIAAENLLAGLRGDRLIHCVNSEVYERR